MKKLIYTAAFILLTTLPSFSQGPYNMPDNIGAGNCLEFDGVDDYADIPNIAAYDFGSGNFTVEFWIKYSDNSAPDGLVVSATNNVCTTIGWAIIGQGGIISFMLRDGNGACSPIFLSSTTTLNNDEWYHVSAVRLGSPTNQIQLYINGIQEATGTANETLTSGRNIVLGRRYLNLPNFYHLDGQIDEVRIWNVARTQAQIRDNMCRQLTGTETGLVGYWNMNEGTGNTVNDLTTNNNHGTRQ